MSKESEQSTSVNIGRPTTETAIEDNLRALYNHTYDETKHFRTFEWQITVWATAIIGAVV
jgi:hypothetical protein